MAAAVAADSGSRPLRVDGRKEAVAPAVVAMAGDVGLVGVDGQSELSQVDGRTGTTKETTERRNPERGEGAIELHCRGQLFIPAPDRL